MSERSSDSGGDGPPRPVGGPEEAAVMAAEAEAASAARAGSRLQARTTGLVSLAILSSRLLGLVREVVFAGLFGANRFTDAFSIAFRTPNMLRDLFAEGALSTAFVTTFSKKIASEGDEAAWELARRMATLVAVFMSVIVVLGILLAPVIIRILMPDWEGEQIDFTVTLARIMYPFIGIVSMSALVMGMLNAKGRFFLPALASSFFNIGSIVGGTALGYWMDPTFGPRALMGFAAGTLIGGLCQLGIQLPSLWRSGFRFRPDFRWRDSGVRKVLSLMWPAVISGSAVQVNVLLNSIFASFLVMGSVSWLEKAFRLMQLPLGVFGVAVGMVALPAASRAAAGGITPEFNRLLAKGMRLVALPTLASAVGLAILATPIISLIYERGKFNAEDSAMAGAALQSYALGLVFYAAIKVIQPAFYAIDRRFVPMMVSFASIAVNAGLNAFFIFVLDVRERQDGHRFLALSTSISAAINFVVLYLMMRRFAGPLGTGRPGAALGKLLVAGAVLAAVCLAGDRWLLGGWESMSFLRRAGLLLPLIAAGGAAFAATAWVLGVGEVREFGALLRGRLLRK